MRKFSFRNAFILSMVLHFGAVIVLNFSKLTENASKPTETITVEFVEKSPEKQKDLLSAKTKQIVEQDQKSINDEAPLTDAYLSAANQRVKKETVAKERGEFRNLKTTTKVSKSATPSQQKSEATEKPNRSLKALMGSDPIANLQKNEKFQKESLVGEDGSSGAEASRSNDYLKNVAESGETLLNTREFKYYTYYTRIRRQLAQHWEPKVKNKLSTMFRQGRKIASEKDHVTKLLIILNERGLLVGVQVVTESGVTDLDDAATEAFRAAAPFPNPPTGIIESDGTVKIRWDFVLES